MVRLTANGHVATGVIDARRQRDDVWEAWVDYSYPTENGFSSHHKDWFPMSDLEVIDYVPAERDRYRNARHQVRTLVRPSPPFAPA